MPLHVTGGDRKLLLAAGGVSLLLTGGGVLLSPELGDAADEATTYSVGSGGARAAYLLLGQSGFDVRRWEESVVNLPQEPATLVLADPQGAPTGAERRAIGQFIERGGRVIATGMAGALFLPERRVVSDPFAGITWKRLSSRSPSSVTRAAPEITLVPRAYWDPMVFAVPLYGDGERDHVVTYDHGDGDVMWWASATPLTNAGMREPGNLEFVLASLGDRRRRVLWDEYFHGHRPVGSSALLALPALTWTAAHLLLLAVAVIMTYSRRSGPIIAHARDSRLSPLEFVRTLGSLYQRAGAASVAVDIQSHRFRYQLARQLGRPGNASVDDLERAVREHWGIDDSGFGDLLRSCEAARSDASLKPAAALALTQSLADYGRKFGLFRS